MMVNFFGEAHSRRVTGNFADFKPALYHYSVRSISKWTVFSFPPCCLTYSFPRKSLPDEVFCQVTCFCSNYKNTHCSFTYTTDTLIYKACWKSAKSPFNVLVLSYFAKYKYECKCNLAKNSVMQIPDALITETFISYLHKFDITQEHFMSICVQQPCLALWLLQNLTTSLGTEEQYVPWLYVTTLS